MVTKYYVVLSGYETGIFTDWNKVQKLITGYPGAMFKCFFNMDQAKNFIIKRSSTTITTKQKSHYNSSKTVIYTDGICINGHCGFGIVILSSKGDKFIAYGHIPEVINIFKQPTKPQNTNLTPTPQLNNNVHDANDNLNNNVYDTNNDLNNNVHDQNNDIKDDLNNNLDMETMTQNELKIDEMSNAKLLEERKRKREREREETKREREETKKEEEDNKSVPTNNFAGIYSIYIALSLVSGDATIYSTSEYSILCLTSYIKNWIAQDWKGVANRKIIEATYNKISGRNISFVHIKQKTQTEIIQANKLAEEGQQIQEPLIIYKNDHRL